MNVTLLDGRAVPSTSEAWRHECEARFVANLKPLASRRTYLDGVGVKRGPAAMAALEETVATLFAARRQEKQQ